MGTDSFKKLYGELLELYSLTKKTTQYYGKFVFIDAHFQIYRMEIGKIGNIPFKLTSSGKNVSHILDLFNHVVQLIMRGLIPVYVFDGGAPSAKEGCLEKRRTDKLRAEEKYKCISDKTSEESIKQLKRSFRITSEMIVDCTTLLDLMGICWIIADKEADQQCAAMCNYYMSKIPTRIAGIMTNDTDIFTYGGKVLLKDFSLSNNQTLEINRKDILDFLQSKSDLIRQNFGLKSKRFRFSNFVDLSILMGTDYKKKCRLGAINVNILLEMFVINGMNVKNTVREMQKKYGISVPHDFMESYREVKELYSKSTVIHPADIDILPRQNDTYDDLTQFMCDDNEFDRKLISESVNKFSRGIKKFLVDYHSISDAKYSNFGSYRKKYYKTKDNAGLLDRMLVNQTPNSTTDKRKQFYQNSNVRSRPHLWQHNLQTAIKTH